MTRTRLSFSNLLFIVVFAIMLWLPLLSWLTGTSPDSTAQEKRQKTTWTQVVEGENGNRRTRFEQFFNDNFGFRDQLVKAHNRLDYSLLQSNAKVHVGKDGWLFLERGLNANMAPIVDELCGRVPFSDDDLAYWEQHLTANWQQLTKSHRQYILAVVPNKHTLYRQFLPDHLHCPPTTTRLHVLRDRLKNRDGFPFLDLLDPLLTAAGGPVPVYHQTDTHWNRVGVYVAYEQLLDLINSTRTGPDEHIHSVLDTDRIVAASKNSSQGDLALMLGLGDSISETMEGFRIRRTMAKLRRDPLPGYSEDPYRQPVAFVNPSRGSLPRILVFHDSFVGKRVQLLLAETFSHATFVWNSGPTIPFEVVDKVKPDIVIHEMVERSLLQRIRR